METNQTEIERVAKTIGSLPHNGRIKISNKPPSSQPKMIFV